MINPIKLMPRKGNTRLQFLTLLAHFALLCISTATMADDYVLGQGLLVGDFVLSGYVNFVAEAPKDQPSSLSADDLSLFVSGKINRWVNPFIESEVTSVTLAQAGGGAMQRGHFVAERLYDDVLISDEDSLRIGKILAPVGDWNLIHAAPLVPITTRPLTTNRGFSEYASGLSWVHNSFSLGRPDWQIYAQPGSEWLHRPSNVSPRHYRNVWGGHLNWRWGLMDKLGLSLQEGQQEIDGQRYTLLGTNVHKTYGRLKLESEATYARWGGGAARGTNREWGVYLLGDYALHGGWHVIGEAEHFHERYITDPSRNLLAGLAWKPLPTVVLKLEYVKQTGRTVDIPTGWLAALSVLF